MHCIKEYDIVVAREDMPTWHNLDIKKKSINSVEDACLDWGVCLVPAYVRSHNGFTEVPESKFIQREDNGLVLGVRTDSYGIVQNSRIWELMDNALTGLEYDVTCAGSLDNCRKVFISVAIRGQQKYVTNADEFQANINFLSSHDGSYKLNIMDSIIRVVCMNTFCAAMGSNKKSYLNKSVKHSKNCDGRITDLERDIQNLLQYREEWFTSLERLANVPFTLEEATGVASAFLLSTQASKKEMSTRSFNAAKEISNLFVNGSGNHGKSAYDMFNAVTEFYTHGTGVGSKDRVSEEKRVGASEYGTAAKNKADFYETLVALVDKGTSKIKDYARTGRLAYTEKSAKLI